LSDDLVALVVDRYAVTAGAGRAAQDYFRLRACILANPHDVLIRPNKDQAGFVHLPAAASGIGNDVPPSSTQ